MDSIDRVYGWGVCARRLAGLRSSAWPYRRVLCGVTTLALANYRGASDLPLVHLYLGNKTGGGTGCGWCRPVVKREESALWPMDTRQGPVGQLFCQLHWLERFCSGNVGVVN